MDNEKLPNESPNHSLSKSDSSTSNYFTNDEIEEFNLQGSLPFPFMVYEGTDPNNVIEVSEIVSMSGMSENKGTPTELTVYKHVKGKETEKLVYRLVQLPCH